MKQAKLAVKASPTDTLRPAENNPLTNDPYILCTVLNYALLAQCMLGDSDVSTLETIIPLLDYASFMALLSYLGQPKAQYNSSVNPRDDTVVKRKVDKKHHLRLGNAFLAIAKEVLDPAKTNRLETVLKEIETILPAPRQIIALGKASSWETTTKTKSSIIS